MGKLTLLILSILCAVLQHEILASSSGGASSSDSSTARSSRSSSTSSPIPSSTPPSSPRFQIYHDGTRMRAVVIKGQMSPAYEQSVYIVHTENPTHVELTRNGDILGHGLAIHCYFVVSRPKFLRQGYEVSTHEGAHLKPHEVMQTIPHGNVILIHMREPILLGNGYSEPSALSKQGYTPEEITWADNYVKRYIEEVYTPDPRMTGRTV